MPTEVSISNPFRKDLDHLARKYPKVLDTIESLITDLENDMRPGDKIPRVGYDVYKVRLPNPSAGRGKRGGFRAIYYVQLQDRIILLIIYSKTEQSDISPDEIRRVLEDIEST